MLTEPNKPASKGQTWALFCALKCDFRGVTMTYGEAHDLLTLANTDKGAALARATALGAIVKGKAPAERKDFKSIFRAAHEAGMEAGNARIPTPMVVSQRANVLDDNSAVLKSYFVPSGVCGFAWVNIRDARSAAAKAAKEHAGARPAYRGGMQIWVGEFGQSMEQKEAYAGAYARVLGENGIEAYADSRID
jgi:hypothetical protein